MAFRPPTLSTFVTAVITGLLTAGSLLIVGNATIYGDATVRSLTATSTAVGLSVVGRAQIDGNVTTTVGLTPATANTGAIGTDAYPFATARFGTSLAVPAINVTSTGAGLTLYNTTDQVTNYERGVLNFQSNVLTLDTEAAGTGGTRSIRIGDGSNADVLVQTSSFPHVLLRRGASTNAASTSDGVVEIRTGSLTAASSKQMVFRVEPTFAQSGTAAYTVLDIDATESSTGSGEKLFADFKVGGTSQLKIDNAGKLYAGGSYGGLAEGDGYYFGDEVRGLRFLTGDDFEFQNWHVGGQFYMSVYNGSARTRFAVFDAPTKRSAFSSSVDLRNYTPNTDLEVIGTASATTLVVSPGSAGTPSIQFSGDSNTGIYSDADNAIAYVAGGQVVFGMSNASAVNTSRYTFRPTSGAGSNTVDIGTSAINWRHGFFGGQVSSTSLMASATGTIGYLSVGNGYDTSQQASLMVKHTPTQSEATQRLPFLALWNTSSTLGTPLVFLNDDATNYIASITAYGDTAPFNGDFGFAPANMVMLESTSGTIMTAGDAVAILSASGAFRPITGLGFGNVENLDPFGASASTTITNGNMASASLDFPNSAAAGTQDLTITVMGARDGDECQLGVLNALASRASEAFTCFVSAANTITVRRTCVAAIGCGDPGAATVKAGFFSRQ